MRILTTPLITPKIKLHNRLVLPPIATEKATADGYSTDAVLHYYDEKSRGGCIALIITEHCYITHQGKASAFQLSVADDSTIEGWKKLADILHKNGIKAAMQINHAGSAADNDGLEIVGPSVIRHPQKKETSNSDCVTAASAFEKAGLDILDISGGHCGFTNPLSIEPGYFSDMSLAVKQKIAIPVILTGGISTAEQAEALLENGAADLIGVGRAILRDSDWACNAV